MVRSGRAHPPLEKSAGKVSVSDQGARPRLRASAEAHCAFAGSAKAHSLALMLRPGWHSIASLVLVIEIISMFICVCVGLN